MGLSKSTFVVGLVIAVLASSFISALIAMQWALIQGPKGDEGESALEHDSGWIDVTDKVSEYSNVTHNLSNTDIMAEMTGKTTLNSGLHQRNLSETEYTPKWNRTYGGTGRDWARSVVQTVDGGYAIAGFTESFGAGNSDFWLIKTNSVGKMQWNQTYGGTGTDCAYSVVQTVDGGYVIAGEIGSLRTGHHGFWLVKADSTGNMQWNRTYGGTGNDHGCSVVQTNDGGYAIAGFTESFGAGNSDFWLIKLPYGNQSGVSLPVPYEGQGDTDWCWAASATMVLRYYGKQVHVWDVGIKKCKVTSLGQIESCVKESYPDEFEFCYGFLPVSDQTRQHIEGNISMGYPVLLRLFDFKMRGHVVVVTGYNSSGFFINDPSGAFFVEELKRDRNEQYIHEFVTWENLKPYIIPDLSLAVFLVTKGIPSPINATLFLKDDEYGMRTIHEADHKYGVCVDYGDIFWSWSLDWRPINWYPRIWNPKDKLEYFFQIFNHKNQTARFDFFFRIEGQDGYTYYASNITDIQVSAFSSEYAYESNIVLKDNLTVGQEYIVTAEITHHGSKEIVDSITLPPIYYGERSIMFVAECPVRMLVTDPYDLRVGFDPVSNQTVNEIPNAMYYHGNESEPELISIPNQKDGNYSVTLLGIEDGTYNFTWTSLNKTGFLSTENLINITIKEGESQIHIIPEFPSTTVLLLTLMFATFAVATGKACRKHASEK